MRAVVIGTGGIGRVHMRQYAKMPDIELGGLDVDPDRCREACEMFGALPQQSLSEAISWADIVDVCIPTDLHLGVAEQVIASGRALFLEKPIAGTVADARKLCQSAESAGIPAMPGQVVRFFPEFAAGRRAVASGKIGTPAAARTRRGGKAPSGAGGWFQDFGRSGGVLLDLAIHDFDWLRWTLGEVNSVYAMSPRFGQGRQRFGEFVGDYALTTIRFDSGAAAHVEATWMDPSGFRTTFEVCGSEGMIEYDSRQTPTLKSYLDATPLAESPLSSHDDPYYQQLRSFVEAVQASTTPPVSMRDGLAAVSIACAALESAATGKAIPPESHLD